MFGNRFFLRANLFTSVDAGGRIVLSFILLAEVAKLVNASDLRPSEVRSFGKCIGFDIFGLCQSGGMADAADSKSVARKGVWVQVPPLVFNARLFFPAKVAV